MVRILSHVGDPPQLRQMLQRRGVQAEVLVIPPDGTLPQDADGQVLLTPAQGTPNLAAVLDRGVEWVHTVGTGVDEFPLELLGGRPLTVSRGATSVSIAEWVMAQILTAEKKLPQSWVTSPPPVWGGEQLGGVQDSTIAILGLGSIGAAVATRALAFGAQVRALRRSDGPSPVPGVTLVRDAARLVEGADHIVLAAPLTDATRGVVDAALLAQMNPEAHLINVARDGLVVADELRAALDSGRLALASIDVAPVEPLPAGHWLYSHPRVRFSPHTSWSGRGVWESLLESFADNYERWCTHRPLLNVVDPIHKY